MKTVKTGQNQGGGIGGPDGVGLGSFSTLFQGTLQKGSNLVTFWGVPKRVKKRVKNGFFPPWAGLSILFLT